MQEVAIPRTTMPQRYQTRRRRVNAEPQPVARPRRGERRRRILNILAASILLIVLAPVMLLVAILIKLDSRGPVFYTQSRVGVDRRSGRVDDKDRRRSDLGGRPFTIYKFRTMTHRPSDTSQAWASQTDCRVTRLGRILRTHRIDELPQLFNVLKGDMNLVGPRPEQPAIFSELREQIPEYVVRQRVLPGITGWAQVNQSYDTCLEDVRRKVKLDQEYIDQRSPRNDLKIMVKTVGVMVGRKGGW